MTEPVMYFDDAASLMKPHALHALVPTDEPFGRLTAWDC